MEREEEEVVARPAEDRHLDRQRSRGQEWPGLTSKSSSRLMMLIGSQQTVNTTNMERRMRLLYLKYPDFTSSVSPGGGPPVGVHGRLPPGETPCGRQVGFFLLVEGPQNLDKDNQTGEEKFLISVFS